jgi:hypothetical protein
MPEAEAFTVLLEEHIYGYLEGANSSRIICLGLSDNLLVGLRVGNAVLRNEARLACSCVETNSLMPVSQVPGDVSLPR